MKATRISSILAASLFLAAASLSAQDAATTADQPGSAATAADDEMFGAAETGHSIRRRLAGGAWRPERLPQVRPGQDRRLDDRQDRLQLYLGQRMGRQRQAPRPRQILPRARPRGAGDPRREAQHRLRRQHGFPHELALPEQIRLPDGRHLHEGRPLDGHGQRVLALHEERQRLRAPTSRSGPSTPNSIGRTGSTSASASSPSPGASARAPSSPPTTSSPSPPPSTSRIRGQRGRDRSP